MNDFKDKPIKSMVPLDVAPSKPTPTFESRPIDIPTINKSGPIVREIVTSNGNVQVIDFTEKTPPYFNKPIIEVGDNRVEIHHFIPSESDNGSVIKPSLKSLALYWTDGVKISTVSTEPDHLFFQGKKSLIPVDLAQMHVDVNVSDTIYIEKYIVRIDGSEQQEMILSRVCSDSDDLNDGILKSFRWLIK